MRDSKRFERGFPPLAKEGQGGFEHASQNPPQSPFFKLIFTRIFGLWALRGQGGRAKGENFSQQSEIS